jgi:hypothetical protein
MCVTDGLDLTYYPTTDDRDLHDDDLDGEPSLDILYTVDFFRVLLQRETTLLHSKNAAILSHLTSVPSLICGWLSLGLFR